MPISGQDLDLLEDELFKCSSSSTDLAPFILQAFPRLGPAVQKTNANCKSSGTLQPPELVPILPSDHLVPILPNDYLGMGKTKRVKLKKNMKGRNR